MRSVYPTIKCVIIIREQVCDDIYRESRSINRNVGNCAVNEHLGVWERASKLSFHRESNSILGRELSARCNSKTVGELSIRSPGAERSRASDDERGGERESSIRMSVDVEIAP